MEQGELSGKKTFHIYLATEDPLAVRLFRGAAPPNWMVHASGPKNPLPTDDKEVRVTDVATESNGQAGL